MQLVEANRYLQIGSMIRSHLAESCQRSVTNTWMHAATAATTAAATTTALQISHCCCCHDCTLAARIR
eukprot:15983-Heterococcus_DN1.PRE.4